MAKRGPFNVLTNVKTGEATYSNLFETDPQVNEFMLYHGTAVIDEIVKDGFEFRRSGNGKFGTLTPLCHSAANILLIIFIRRWIVFC